MFHGRIDTTSLSRTYTFVYGTRVLYGAMDIMEQELDKLKDVATGKYNFEKLEKRHDLLAYIEKNKEDIFTDYNKWKKKREQQREADMQKKQLSVKLDEDRKINTIKEQYRQESISLKEENEALKKDVARERKNSSKIREDNEEFKKLEQKLQEHIANLENKINERDLKIKQHERTIEKWSGQKPSKEESDIIKDYLKDLRKEVNKTENKYLREYNKLNNSTVENINKRNTYLNNLIQELRQIAARIQYDIDDLNISTAMSEKLKTRIKNLFENGIDEYQKYIKEV
mgnify:CR=1 FL=1